MSYFPCKNPNCKSYGKPHPNCKCSIEMAEGGEASHFCDSNESHKNGCEYSNGGDLSLGAPPDPSHAVSGYLANHGLHGLLKMKDHHDIDSYHSAIKKGHKIIDQDIEGCFGKDNSRTVDHEKSHKLIDDWMTKGGVDNDIQHEIYNQNSMQNFADGGHVHEKHEGILHQTPVAEAHPEHQIMLQAAKGRMSNYLNSLRTPEHTPRLAFDDEPDHKDQKKSYKRAVTIAAHPLSILDKIKKGTIEPEHIKHLNALHPEVNENLQKKLTERIIEAQLKGEKPSLKVRQGLSLLTGTPLSGELTPQNIQAAQLALNSTRPQPAQGQPSTGEPSPTRKKGTAALTKSDQAFLTGGQALEKRAQKV